MFLSQIHRKTGGSCRLVVTQSVFERTALRRSRVRSRAESQVHLRLWSRRHRDLQLRRQHPLRGLKLSHS